MSVRTSKKKKGIFFYDPLNIFHSLFKSTRPERCAGFLLFILCWKSVEKEWIRLVEGVVSTVVDEMVATRWRTSFRQFPKEIWTFRLGWPDVVLSLSSLHFAAILFRFSFNSFDDTILVTGKQEELLLREMMISFVDRRLLPTVVFHRSREGNKFALAPTQRRETKRWTPWTFWDSSFVFCSTVFFFPVQTFRLECG